PRRSRAPGWRRGGAALRRPRPGPAPRARAPARGLADRRGSRRAAQRAPRRGADRPIASDGAHPSAVRAGSCRLPGGHLVLTLLFPAQEATKPAGGPPMAREAVIVDSVRTGLTKAHRGSFNITEPVDYTAHVLREVVSRQRNLDPEEVEDVNLGCGI